MTGVRGPANAQSQRPDYLVASDAYSSAALPWADVPSESVGREAELASLCDAVESGRDTILVGAAGIGKTHLACVVAARLDDSHHVEHLVGAAAVRDLQFSTVAHLLDGIESFEAPALVRAVHRTLLQRAGGRPLLLVVDDIDQVDGGTAASLHHLLTDPEATVLATVRADRAAAVVDLWRTERAERRDIRPLTTPATVALAEVFLGGPVAAELADRVVMLAAGNPLFTRELVLGARASGAIELVDGTWHLRGPLTPSARLRDLIVHRVGHLDDASRRALEVTAVCEPVRIEVAEHIATPHDLEVVERGGLVTVDGRHRRPEIRVAHPLIGEVLRAELPESTTRSIKRQAAAVLLSGDDLEPTDQLRTAIWLLEAGAALDGRHALGAAQAAETLLVPQLTERLARMAAERGTDQHRAAVLLGRALRDLGRLDEAESILRQAIESASNDHQTAAAGVALAELQTFGRADATTAITQLRTTLATVEEPSDRALLIAQLMLAHGLVGQFQESLRLGKEVLDHSPVDDRTRVPVLMATTLAQSMVGDVELLAERLDEAEQMAVATRDRQPFAFDQIRLNQALASQALLVAGEAEQLCEDILAGDDGRPRGEPTLAGVWEQMLAMTTTMTGSVARGVEVARRARVLLADQDPLGMFGMSIGACALLEAMADTEPTTDGVRDDPRLDPLRARIWLVRGDAWRLARDGRSPEAGAQSVAIGREAIEGAHVAWGALALDDATQFGRVDEAAAILDQLESSSPLVRAVTGHARALRAQDGAGLDTVAERFWRGGTLLLACRTFADAARVHDDHGCAARAAYRAAVLAGRSHGLELPEGSTVESPLSPREMEIAGLAADGLSSRSVSELLVLSRRTVDNHLGAVYDKLAIDGRGALVALHHGGPP